MSETQPDSQLSIHNYWGRPENKGTYVRLSVKKHVDRFCGWKPLMEMLNYFRPYSPESNEPHTNPKEFFITLFQTGARCGECLSLRRQNLTILDDRILVEYILSKRFKKVGLRPPGDPKGKWFTEKKTDIPREFAINRSEPFSPLLVDFLGSITDMNALLFPSHFRHKPSYLHSHPKASNDLHPLSKVWAYKVFRRLGDDLPGDLRQQLGLYRTWNKEWTDGLGVKHKNELHLWLHWCRAMKARQLRHDYGLDLEEVQSYFEWESLATASTYANTSKETTEKKMFGTPSTH